MKKQSNGFKALLVIGGIFAILATIILVALSFSLFFTAAAPTGFALMEGGLMLTGDYASELESSDIRFLVGCISVAAIDIGAFLISIPLPLITLLCAIFFFIGTTKKKAINIIGIVLSVLVFVSIGAIALSATPIFLLIVLCVVFFPAFYAFMMVAAIFMILIWPLVLGLIISVVSVAFCSLCGMLFCLVVFITGLVGSILAMKAGKIDRENAALENCVTEGQ